MKVLKNIIVFIPIVLKGMTLVLKLSVMLPGYYLAKTISKRQFRRQLAGYGVPEEVTRQLTRSYMDMVNLQVLSNIKTHKKNK